MAISTKIPHYYEDDYFGDKQEFVMRKMREQKQLEMMRQLQAHEQFIQSGSGVQDVSKKQEPTPDLTILLLEDV